MGLVRGKRGSPGLKLVSPGRQTCKFDNTRNVTDHGINWVDGLPCLLLVRKRATLSTIMTSSYMYLFRPGNQIHVRSEIFKPPGLSNYLLSNIILKKNTRLS